MNRGRLLPPVSLPACWRRWNSAAALTPQPPSRPQQAARSPRNSPFAPPPRKFHPNHRTVTPPWGHSPSRVGNGVSGQILTKSRSGCRVPGRCEKCLPHRRRLGLRLRLIALAAARVARRNRWSSNRIPDPADPERLACGAEKSKRGGAEAAERGAERLPSAFCPTCRDRCGEGNLSRFAHRPQFPEADERDFGAVGDDFGLADFEPLRLGLDRGA